MRKEKFEVDGGKCMSDLYVSDLDGTLLRSNEVTSKYTNQVINSLVEEGMIFSYATARSLVTAKKSDRRNKCKNSVDCVQWSLCD